MKLEGEDRLEVIEQRGLIGRAFVCPSYGRYGLMFTYPTPLFLPFEWED